MSKTKSLKKLRKIRKKLFKNLSEEIRVIFDSQFEFKRIVVSSESNEFSWGNIKISLTDTEGKTFEYQDYSSEFEIINKVFECFEHMSVEEESFVLGFDPIIVFH